MAGSYSSFFKASWRVTWKWKVEMFLQKLFPKTIYLDELEVELELSDFEFISSLIECSIVFSTGKWNFCKNLLSYFFSVHVLQLKNLLETLNKSSDSMGSFLGYLVWQLGNGPSAEDISDDWQIESSSCAKSFCC